MAKKSKNSKLLVHYTRTTTPENLSKAANYVGGYVLKGLGALGKIFTAPLTGGPLGPATVVLPKTKKLLDAERKLRETQEELIGKAMTWVSPLNYGAALMTGNGLNAKKGEEEVASWSPAWQAAARLGELYVGPKVVKGVKSTPKAVVNAAAKAGSKTAKKAVVAREINKGIKQNTKNGRIEVTEDYFNSPDKWYRITETPEKYGIMELGKNVTTHDAALTVGTINGWRSSMLRAPITKSSEGFIKRPHKIELNIRRKNGQAHGNTSQAAKGLLWGGTTSGSNLFPEGVIEGQAPSMINYGLDRTNFVITPWELVPNGGRIGFHTGEMPMENLGWFQRTNKGTYTYEPIISEKRISYLPKLLLEPLASLASFERNHPFKGKQLTEHVQGDEAIKMFKEYGGEPIPEGSINGELLRKYVAEARERYGLRDNKNVTDEEIALALYKHSKELGENTAAVNAQGEPLLLFRGDTKAYTELRNNHHESGGTEDNVLGTLFLDRTGISEGWGPDRYLYLSNENGLVMAPYRTGIESESFSLLEPKFKEGYLYNGFGKGYISDKQISYPYWSYTRRSGETIQGNKIASDNFADGTVNHLNAFVVRTPKVRDITNEVVVTGGSPGTPPPFNWLIPKESRIGHDLHDVRLALNKAVVEEAKKHNQGLLKSDRGSYWRGEEHENYDYYALPDFNVQGAKHLLPYDLRIPRNWKDKNIYRGLIPLAGGYTLYNLFNQPLQQLQYLKQGGKMNILEFLKNGSGIHIKKKNRGKFTSYCGGKVTDECILKGKNSSNPAIRKRATFAANARKWKHKEGGIIKAGDGLSTSLFGLLPGVGTYLDYKEFEKNPNWKTGLSLGVSALGDAAMLTGAGALIKGISAANKARKILGTAGKAANVARLLVWNQASKLKRESDAVNSLTLMGAPTNKIIKRLASKNLAKKSYEKALKNDEAALKVYLTAANNPAFNFNSSQFAPLIYINPGFHTVSLAIKHKKGGIIKATKGTAFGLKVSNALGKVGNFLNSDWGKLAASGISSMFGGGNSEPSYNNNYSDIMTNTALLYMLNQLLENEVLNNYDKIMSKLHFDPSNPNANGGSIVKNHVNYLAQAPVLAGLKEFNDRYKKFLDEQAKYRKTNYITNALTNTLLTGFDLALNYKPTTKKGSSVS